MSVSVGQIVPEFSAAATGERRISLSELRGKRVALYFYPKDNTSGCTTEGQQFRDLYDRFSTLNTVILGVSRDSVRSHENFRAKHAFPFPLLADTDETLCRLFDVIKLKKNYGKEALGVERSTFLIDAEGVLRQEWRKVKVDGHAAQVLAAVEALS
ncbi:MAG TPA: peroxiredoxin [Candidatus Competibacteraceae bacterium]|nr:peroxiredoxin [Candidatus Competibacteraceae bacterium]HQA26163.1 peroxiredoxin [Candidatus Competibacteraceae bacterium]HQD55338.1 peroxiredoxin [Candidatus Competibacteraceae bacterium]